MGWFLSYLLILALPIFTGMVIYRVALINSYTQAQKQNQSMMRLVMSEVDNEIVRLQNEISRLALDQTVHILADAKERFQRGDQMQLYTLYRDLRNIGFLEKYEEDVFIYFKNTDYIVSAKGNMSFPVYYRLYFKDSLLSEEELRACLWENHFQDIVPLQTNEGRDLLLVSTSLEADVRQGCASIGIRMKNEKLGQLLDSLRWDDQICFYVMNKNGQLVRDTGIEAINAYLGEEGTAEYDEEVNINGVSYYVSTAKSDMTGWGYSMLLPGRFIKESAKSIQSCAMVGLFICVFASFLLSCYLTKKNYHPLKSLISIFGSHDSIKGENEYQWLAEKVKQMMKEQTDVEEQIEQNRTILEGYALFRLLEYPYDAEDAIQEYIGCRGQLSGRNTVVLFSFAGEKKDADEKYMQKNSQNKFIVRNIFTELAGSCFHVEMAELGDEAAAIVCLGEENMERLKEIIENTQQMIRRWFSIMVMAVAGGVQEGASGIHESYLEAREAEEYIALLESDIIFYQDICNVNHKYFYPIEREEKIIGAIRAGDAETACGYVSQLLEINCRNRPSPNLWKCLLIDMLGTVLKGAEGFPCTQEDFEFAKELSAKISLEEAKKLFSENIAAICKNSRTQPDGRDNRLSEKVKQYIEENYWNPDLNISMTADYFNRTPSYLSAVFKEQTKESLLLYINMVRIKKAEQLLKQGSSVAEAAEKTGFRESGTFIRVFKKHMGITPGQIKKDAGFGNMQNIG